jgi:hypothetical protein
MYAEGRSVGAGPSQSLQIGGPFQTVEDGVVVFGRGAQDEAQGLLVGCRGADSGQGHELFEGGHGDGDGVVESAVAAVFKDKILEHDGLLVRWNVRKIG